MPDANRLFWKSSLGESGTPLVNRWYENSQLASGLNLCSWNNMQISKMPLLWLSNQLKKLAFPLGVP